MEKLILLPLIAVCLTRTASYGVYTARDNNKTGAAGLFALALIAALMSVYFYMR